MNDGGGEMKKQVSPSLLHREMEDQEKKRRLQRRYLAEICQTCRVIGRVWPFVIPTAARGANRSTQPRSHASELQLEISFPYKQAGVHPEGGPPHGLVLSLQ